MIPVAEGKCKLKKELLWTNPNPTQSFSSQTIQIDLSPYSEIEIFAIFSDANVEGSNTFKAPVGMAINIGFVRSDLYLMQSRIASTTSSGVTFSDATLGQDRTVYNNHCIPEKIWGIR